MASAPIIPVHFNKDLTGKKAILKRFLVEYYPLLSVLIGFLLVAFSAGPFTNGDTDWEIDAVTGVLKSGLPLANGGYLMDQPPLGFYLQATFAKAVGSLSFTNGTVLVTLFGLGCVALVYSIGHLMYNRTSGFFGALIFAFSPWHLLMSRSFLIDVPCLFFSLLTVSIGLIAIKNSSLKLFLVSGIAFAAAFSTKLYAVFALIPVLTFFFYYRPKKIKPMLIWLLIFTIPVLLSIYLWYDAVTNTGVLSIFLHSDFYSPIPVGVTPAPFFVWNFLVSYSLGWFFIDAIGLSLLFLLLQRKLLHNFALLDFTSVAVILCVVGVDVLLGAFLGLKSPFFNAFKYVYQALPYFCLLAGALVAKSVIFLKQRRSRLKLHKAGFIVGGLTGFVLFASAVYYCIHNFQMYSTWTYILFKVEPTASVGYTLFNPTPILHNSPQMFMQLIGYVVATTGVLWISRQKIAQLKAHIPKKRKQM